MRETPELTPRSCLASEKPNIIPKMPKQPKKHAKKQWYLIKRQIQNRPQDTLSDHNHQKLGIELYVDTDETTSHNSKIMTQKKNKTPRMSNSYKPSLSAVSLNAR